MDSRRALAVPKETHHWGSGILESKRRPSWSGCSRGLVSTGMGGSRQPCPGPSRPNPLTLLTIRLHRRPSVDGDGRQGSPCPAPPGKWPRRAGTHPCTGLQGEHFSAMGCLCFWTWSSAPAFYTPEASSNPPVRQLKCLQTFPSVPWEGRNPQSESRWQGRGPDLQ